MRPRPAPGWRVAIEEHVVARWTIEGQVLFVNAVSAREARVAAAREAHVRAGVAPWKPLLRSTYLRTSVVGRMDSSGVRSDSSVDSGVGVAHAPSGSMAARNGGGT